MSSLAAIKTMPLNIAECDYLLFKVDNPGGIIKSDEVREGVVREWLAAIAVGDSNSIAIINQIRTRRTELMAYRDKAYSHNYSSNHKKACKAFEKYFKLLQGAPDPQALYTYREADKNRKSGARARVVRYSALSACLLLVMASVVIYQLFLGKNTLDFMYGSFERKSYDSVIKAHSHFSRPDVRIGSLGLSDLLFADKAGKLKDRAEKYELIDSLLDDAYRANLAGDNEAAMTIFERAMLLDSEICSELTEARGWSALTINGTPGSTVQVNSMETSGEVYRGVVDSSGIVIYPFMPDGAYELVASKAYHNRSRNQFSITNNQPLTIDFHLQEKPGSILFSGDVNALVYLDGQLVGEANRPIENMQPGAYTFEAIRQDYQPRSFMTVISPGRETKISLPPINEWDKKRAMARFVLTRADKEGVREEVTGAGTLIVNGAQRRVAFPAMVDDLQVGEHAFEAYTASFVSLTDEHQQYTIYPDITNEVNVKVYPKPASITITGTPADAVVAIGTNKYRGGEKFFVAAESPMKIKVSSPGHEVVTLDIPALAPAVHHRKAVTLKKIPQFIVRGTKYLHMNRYYVKGTIENNPANPIRPLARDWVFLVDVSGSMYRYRGAIADTLAKHIGRLTPSDKYLLAGFSDKVHLCNDEFVAPASESIDDSIKQLRRLPLGSGTDLLGALNHIAEMRNKLPSNNPVVLIVITDSVSTKSGADTIDMMVEFNAFNHKGMTVNAVVFRRPESSLFDLITYRHHGSTEFIMDKKGLDSAVGNLLKPEEISAHYGFVRTKSDKSILARTSLPNLPYEGVLKFYTSLPVESDSVEVTYTAWANGRSYSETSILKMADMPEANATIVTEWANDYINEIYWKLIQNARRGAEDGKISVDTINRYRPKIRSLAETYQIKRGSLKDIYPFVDLRSPVSKM